MDFETLQRRLLEHVRICVRNGEMTERGLARMIGISQPHMHHILKGVRVLSLENADRILRRLDLTVWDLLKGGSSGRQVPPAGRPGAGMERNEEGELADSVVERWTDSRKSIAPGAQPQESF